MVDSTTSIITSTTTHTTTEAVADSDVRAVWIILEWFTICVKLGFPAYFLASYFKIAPFTGEPYHFIPKLRCPLFTLTFISSAVIVGCLWDAFDTTDFGGYTSIVTGFPEYCPGENGTLLDLARTYIMEMGLIVLIGHGFLMPLFRCVLGRTAGNSIGVLICWLSSVFFACQLVTMATVVAQFCDMNKGVVLKTYNACLVFVACTMLTAILRLGHFLSFKCKFREWECAYFGIDDSLTIVSNMHIDQLTSKWGNPRIPAIEANTIDIVSEPAYVKMDDNVSSNQGSPKSNAYDDSSETVATEVTVSRLSNAGLTKPLLPHQRKESTNPFQEDVPGPGLWQNDRVTNILEDISETAPSDRKETEPSRGFE